MGTLYVVGIGPGPEDLVAPRARRVIEQADAIIGYTLYLDLVREWLPEGSYHPRPIGAEVDRAREALALAARLPTVALVCSGDAGVYGMAGLAHELRAELPESDERPTIEVVPGITAALAAAALLGTPLGHDFATISLSDLLTPWPVIAQRLEAAAAADFVIVLYNPASHKRRWQLLEARDILLRHRPPSTPVGIVTNAGRSGEVVVQTELGRLSVEDVGMVSVVLIGSTQTRVVGGWIVTPRGYRRMESSAKSGEGVRPGRGGHV